VRCCFRLAPVAFVVAAIPTALILGWLILANAGYIAILTMALYYLMYEWLHTLSHLDWNKHLYLKHIPLVNAVRRMHVAHHILDDPVHCEPVSAPNSLLTGKVAGKFAKICTGAPVVFVGLCPARGHLLSCRESPNREFAKREREDRCASGESFSALPPFALRPLFGAERTLSIQLATSPF
jgi:hypothetical protein